MTPDAISDRGPQLRHGNPPVPAGTAGDARPAGTGPSGGLDERLILVPATPGSGKRNPRWPGQERRSR